MSLTPELALSLARDAYSASTTYFDSSIRKEVEADLRRFQGIHPAGSKYHSDAYRAKSRLFRPKTRTMIRKHEAIAAEAFFATRDVVNIEPQDDNSPVQRGSAALHKELLQYRLTRTIPWFLVCMGAYQEAMNVGLVCSHQHWVYDPKKKKDQPAVDLVPLENVRFDPGANWMDPVNTSPYFIELKPMYVKDVEARMAEGDAKTGEKKWKKLDRAKILAAVKGYSDSIRLQREQGRQDSKENVTAVTSYTIVWVHKNIVEHDGVDYCYYTLGDQELLSDPTPLADSYHHGKRPYVIGYSALEAHKNYPGGPNRMGKDLQAETNEVANQRIENVKLVLNKRYLVGRNRQVDIRSLTRGVAGSATLVNDTEKDVRELEFNDVTASSYKEQEVLNLDFDEATGNFSSASVQANRATNETAKGMELVSNDANVVSTYQLKTFAETWMEPVLRQLVLLEQAYETDEVILAIAGQKAKLDELGFDTITDDLIEQELVLSVSVGQGATNPVERVNRFLTAMRALKELLLDGVLTGYGLKFDEVAKEVFASLGYKDGSRFFDMENADPRVAQLMMEMQKLQQALEAKHPPELIEAQVRLIDAQISAIGPKNKLASAQAVKTGVEASFSAMQGAEVIAAVPQVAAIADVIMQGAGYQLPNPPGVDPNFPMAAGGAQAAPGTPNSAAAAVAPPGGVGTITQGEVSGGAEGDTSPNTPAKRTPGEGAKDGIETQESDSTGPGFRNGGLVAYEDEFGKAGVTKRKDLYSSSMIERDLSALGKPGAMGMQDAAQRALDVRNFNELAKAGLLGQQQQDGGGGSVGSIGPATVLSNVDDRAPARTISGVADQTTRRSSVSAAGALGSGLYGQDDDFLGTDPNARYGLGGFADGGYVSVLERGDMSSPAYRAQLEQRQALQTSAPELSALGAIGRVGMSAINAVRGAVGGTAARTQPVSIGSDIGRGLPQRPPTPQELRQQGLQAIDEAVGTAGRTMLGVQVQDGISGTTPRAVGNTMSSLFPKPVDVQDATARAGVQGFADGGLIQGPGTGTSDSIPAITQDGAPLAVSNGEYKIPPAVVQALGKDFFDELIAQHHTPVQGQKPIYQADAPMDTPLGVETGTIIIPADVVEALGKDFFDRLVQMYGGQS